ncbi:hypothetical protein [Rhizobium sullae]|uniref:Uncharacterized protein n=1 Tax=Rhizobium sullae TaxID=50338 RepID=A0A4R3Q143_RHISU|nr:hypothetical protein [Rhizobium sullae]TCU14750.1 hypothetical protein EV132_108120 [Rhizobium sullae]
MKIQPLFGLAVILAGFFASQAALADEMPSSDPICAVINEARANMRKGSGYRELIYQPMKGGRTREYREYVILPDKIYWRFSGRTEWKTSDPPGVWRFTKCTVIKDKDGFHYLANWHGEESLASAEVWLTPDRKKFVKTIRRFRRGELVFPFSVVTSIFDYEAEKAKPPAGME